MSDGQLVGAVIALAMVALWFYVTWEFYLAPLRDEWADLVTTVDQLRADCEPLLDRIAREQAPDMVSEIETYLDAR